MIEKCGENAPFWRPSSLPTDLKICVTIERSKQIKEKIGWFNRDNFLNQIKTMYGVNLALVEFYMIVVSNSTIGKNDLTIFKTFDIFHYKGNKERIKL